MILTALVLSLTGQLAANGPLDELIARDSSIVVAGRVTATQIDGPDMGRGFTLDVARVLKAASGVEVPASLDLVAAYWPDELGLPLEPGAEILATLVTDTESSPAGGFRLEPHVRAVVPIVLAALPEGEIERSALVPEIAKNVLAGADAVTHPVLRAARVRLAAETIEPGMRKLLAPCRASRDAWVRRAALGASLRLGPEEGDVDLVAKDFREFLAAPQSEVVLPSGARLSPLHLFLESYGELERAAVVLRDAEKCTRFLPLYRALVDATEVVDPFRNERTFYRERIGLAGLAIAGTEDDLARLQTFTRSETPATRQRALDAIARILGLEPVPADEGEFAAKEPAIQAATIEALKARGIETAAPKTATPERTREPIDR